MGIFTKKPTPADCIRRISDALDEVDDLRDMLDATPKGKVYKADWDADRKRARPHLIEAASCLGRAFSTLRLGSLYKTNGEEIDSKIDEVLALREEQATAREVVHHLQEELEAAREVARHLRAVSDGWLGMVQQLSSERDANAVACDAWKEHALAAEAALSSDSPRETDKLRRIRALLMSSIHPDRVPPDDRPAMTRAWQSFMPSFESLLSS
jgi:hypothetical protein